MPSTTTADKACTKCGETKPLEEFHRNANHRDGRQHYCKPCTRRAQRESEWRKQGIPSFDFEQKHQKADEALVLLAEGLRRCPRCEEVYPLNAFPYRYGYCRACTPLADRENKWAARGVPESDFKRKHTAIDYANAFRSMMQRAELQRCGRCERVKPFVAFSVQKGARPSGREPTCRDCRAEAYAANPGPQRQRCRDWSTANPDKRREISFASKERRRMRLAGLPHDGTTREDMYAYAEEWDSYGCHWCSAAFTAENRPVVDHVIPVAWEQDCPGHVWENLALACATCNGAKLAKDPMEWFRADIAECRYSAAE